MLVKQLKETLQLPSKGKVEPMLEMFYKFNPENIIIRSEIPEMI